MKPYKDYYFLKAKHEKYPARSIYKLKEIDNRFSLLKKGMKVLDLGAYPGSWSLGAAEKVGKTGKVVCCDIQTVTIPLPSNVFFFQEDIFHRSESFEQVLGKEGPFNIIMSDMAPQTTGIKFTDQARSFELCSEALAIAKQYLLQEGSFIVKIFMGSDTIELVKEMRKNFQRVTSFKPCSSRTKSKEIFYVGLGFKKDIIS